MSNKPNNSDAPTVFDATALLAEIKADRKPFVLGAESFDLLAPAGWSDAVMEAAQRNDLVGAGKLILGEEDYARFVAAGGSSLLLQRIVTAMFGLPMGESAASSPS
jgi:hypothetical protein